jgi:Rps23 Pro-64 3,4-dihydroxylase Tpa1-like proline 4-hydroxylase
LSYGKRGARGLHMSFSLSQSLDKEAAHAGFATLGYAQISNVLPKENAQRIHKCLVEQTSWNLVFNEKEKHFDLPQDQVSAMSRHDLARLKSAIYSNASNDFQYCYNNYPMFDAYKAGLDEGHTLHRFCEWLNDDGFLSFARCVTGFDDISFVDAQATCYLPGHFLNTHDDMHKSKNRRAAYIFNLTPDWRSDWGGYLQLLDDNDNIRCGLRPAFNVLNIIAIPQRHNVGIVAPFAAGKRLSISGWLRYGEPD